MWTHHNDFPQILHEMWDTSKPPVHESLLHLASELGHWNRTVFGNIYRNKRKLLIQIECIQRNPQYHVNLFLVRLETRLLEEYFAILHQEEVHWFQKCRVQWMTFGDRNTSFYHQSTINQCCRGKVLALKLSNDSWCTDQALLQQHAITYFHELFTAVEDGRSDDGFALTKKVEFWETTKAIKTILKQHKALGPDGFQPFFFLETLDDDGAHGSQIGSSSFRNGLI